jgi:hypothetical protein
MLICIMSMAARFLYEGEEIIYTPAHTCENQMKKKVQSSEIIVLDFLYVGTVTLCNHLFDILLTHKPSGKFYLL